MVMRKRNFDNREKGQAIVEGALTLLVFITFSVAVLDIGQILYFSQSLTERARAAARYGAIYPTQTASIKNVALYGKAIAPTVPKPMLPSMTADMVQVSTQDLDKISGTVTVKIVGYPMRFFTPGVAKLFQARTVSVSLSSEAAF